MNPDTIAHAANPVADTAYADAWRDAEGRATFERIIARERATSTPGRRTARRLVPVALTVAVAAAVAVVIGTPGQHQPISHARQAAWIVTEHPDGSVTVWFRDYSDPEGLQARLRAAGVRANVGTLDTSCYPPSTGSGRFAIVLAEPTMTQSDVERLFPFTTETRELAVDPRYLPADATIWIGFPPPTAATADRFFSLAVQPTDIASVPCPLAVVKSHEPGQHGYLVAPGN